MSNPEHICNMPTDGTAGMGALVYQEAKGTRQRLFQMTKIIPSFRDLYEEAEAFYAKVAERLGVSTEAVFDIDEYKKSQHYLDIVEGRIR